MNLWIGVEVEVSTAAPQNKTRDEAICSWLDAEAPAANTHTHHACTQRHFSISLVDISVHQP